jgi:hypothetical protein
VLLELKKEALSKGAVVKENTEVFKLGFNKKLCLWEVHTSQLTHREDIRMHLLMLEKKNNDNDDDVNDGDIDHGRRCCVNESSSHSVTKSNENVETTTQRPLKYQAKHIVIACGGRSEGIAKLASRALFNQQPDEIQLPVIPVVGQMFRLSHERRSSKENLADINPSSNDTSPPPPPAPLVLNHMICGTESEMFWDNQTKQGMKTHPPNLTHERRDDDDDDDDEGRVVSGGWKPRQVRHLYGKQTHDGSFIFGGDRRVMRN